MSILETIRFALRGITANKMRSGLTVLGILIGVAAVILLVAVGNGSAKAIQDTIEQLGTNTLTVTSGGARQGTTTTATQNTSLTLDMVGALQDPQAAPDVRNASPVVTGTQTLVYEGVDHSVPQFVGTYPTYVSASNYTIAQGSPFTSEDVSGGRRVVLIGSTVAEALFTGVDPVGKQITVTGTLFTVVGVLVQQSLTGYGALSQILIQATAPSTVTAAQAEVTAILNQQLHVTNVASAPYRILNQAQLLQTRANTAATFTLLLGAVAGISLLVGGIGITNIMMVTVTERTREIGIRKALGAPKRTVMTQFLVEATVLSLMGGLLGVAVAVIGSQFQIAGVTPVIVPSSVVLALSVSVAIGLFFGSYPASRAASLRPIEALRYE
jgi:putative ABC transport system permease protein